MNGPLEFTGIGLRFIHSLLHDDARLAELGSKGTYGRFIPQSNTSAERAAHYPCSFFYFVTDVSTRKNGMHILWVEIDYEVVALGYNYQAHQLEQMAARQFQLLHGAGGQVTGGGFINNCKPVDLLRLPQQFGEVAFLRIGATWRLRVRLSSN